MTKKKKATPKKKTKSKVEKVDNTDTSSDEESEGFDWEGLGAEEASRILKGIESIIPEIIKKTVVQGVGNILAGEEGLRDQVVDAAKSTLEGNKKKPKEAMGFLLNQGDAMRKEILRIISSEVRVFLENMDFGGEIAKILTTLSFEIKTEVRFIPNDERVVPSVKNSVKIKRNKKGKTEEEGEEEEKVEPKSAFSRWRRKSRGDSEE